jgi:hypothetical protein
MKFALITPPGGEPIFGMFRLSYHMALAQYLLSDMAYLKMYARIRKYQNGAFIIVDNGAAEEDRPPFDEVVQVANGIKADEIVMPDALRDAEWTFQYTTDTAAQEIVPARKRMIVPQGKSLNEWTHCLERITEVMDYATIGVAKHMVNVDGGRRLCLSRIEEMGLHNSHNVHLLGLNTLRELDEIRTLFPWVRGVDTGMPIGYTQAGKHLYAGEEHCSLQWDNNFDPNFAAVNVSNMLTHCREEI